MTRRGVTYWEQLGIATTCYTRLYINSRLRLRLDRAQHLRLPSFRRRQRHHCHLLHLHLRPQSHHQFPTPQNLQNSLLLLPQLHPRTMPLLRDQEHGDHLKIDLFLCELIYDRRLLKIS